MTLNFLFFWLLMPLLSDSNFSEFIVPVPVRGGTTTTDKEPKLEPLFSRSHKLKRLLPAVVSSHCFERPDRKSIVLPQVKAQGAQVCVMQCGGGGSGGCVVFRPGARTNELFESIYSLLCVPDKGTQLAGDCRGRLESVRPFKFCITNSNYYIQLHHHQFYITSLIFMYQKYF